MRGVRVIPGKKKGLSHPSPGRGPVRKLLSLRAGPLKNIASRVGSFKKIKKPFHGKSSYIEIAPCFLAGTFPDGPGISGTNDRAALEDAGLLPKSRAASAVIIIFIGVAGSGKTTLGRKLARVLGCPFYDGDDFHSQANKEKMAKGGALTDEDRVPWLQGLHTAMIKWEGQGPRAVLACSALKQKYRDLLSDQIPVRWVYLKGDIETIRQRLQDRREHFAGPDLLASQFAILEEPLEASLVDIRQEPDIIVKQLLEALKGIV
jgi:gluconokinase